MQNKAPLRAYGQLIPQTVLRVWAVRERVELEAADLFARLARELRNQRGRGDRVTKLALKASMDEQRHATLCRKIIKEGGQLFPPPSPSLGGLLGPHTLNSREQILYTCVALSCITETLSTALLIDMQKKAQPGLIGKTVHDILEDEVSHSRLGWAELARGASDSNVAWISRYIPAMLKEAVESDLRPVFHASELKTDLSPWGILPPELAKKFMLQTITDVILPGFEKFGIQTQEAAAYTRTRLGIQEET